MNIFRFVGSMGSALIALSAAMPAQARSQSIRCILPEAPLRGDIHRRPISAIDLARLRDFGGLGVSISSEPFELAPGGNWVALQIRQADPASNSYCTATVLVSSVRKLAPLVIDDGGEIVASYSTAYGAAEVPKGLPKDSLMRWSPDGQSLAYTKVFPDHSEIWRFDFATHSIRRLATSLVDIEALAWSPDGSALVISSRQGRIAALEAIKSEGRGGYRYDERFRPLYSDRPLISAAIPVVDQAIDAANGSAVPFPGGGKHLLRPVASWPERTVAYAASIGGRNIAWSAIPSQPFGAKPVLNVRMGGRYIGCTDVACSNVQGIWWASDGRTLVFERRAGPADSGTEFYTWKPGRGPVRALLHTDDAIFGCRLAQSKLVCAEETATKPRSLITISMNDGTREKLFDPNPEFAALSLGEVHRLEWSNAFGISTFGDLVLPPGFQHDRRLPLVIVQYESRGFLRGGTGDEYPIQALAARGFAVLSFNRPSWYALTRSPESEVEFNRLNIRDFADRRSNLSSLEAIIYQLDGAGTIDPKRVAITGLSDGAVTATFALANSSLFAAAILSTCCEGPFGLEIAGSALDDYYINGGYPATRHDGQEFWRLGSLADAPHAKAIPLLIQASSAEYRMSLGTYRELSHRGWPIEMYVYPDEGHIKIWPSHRLAIYQSNIEWLVKKLHQ